MRVRVIRTRWIRARVPRAGRMTKCSRYMSGIVSTRRGDRSHRGSHCRCRFRSFRFRCGTRKRFGSNARYLRRVSGRHVHHIPLIHRLPQVRLRFRRVYWQSAVGICRVRWNAGKVSVVGIRQRARSRITVVIVPWVLSVRITLGNTRHWITLNHIVSHTWS